jgi:hypothetical protein
VNWSTASNPPTVTNGQNQVTSPRSYPSMFYRLVFQ